MGLFLVSQIDQKGTWQHSHLKTTLCYYKKDMRSTVLFLTLYAVIQISSPLFQYQMSFASLLQETEMVTPFLLIYAVVLSSCIMLY